MATPTTARSLMRVHPSQVRVVVRIRPFLPAEIAGKSPRPCVSVLDDADPNEVTVHIKDQFSSRNECYKLDSFFGQNDDLGEIFEREVSSVVPGIFRGLNATVFAYGATGSGKTYTMQGTDEHPGLIPQAISMILDKSKDTGSSVEISYYEIYLDRCYDLLEPKAKEISVLEDWDGNVQLKGISLVPIKSTAEFHEAFSCGVQRRKVAHTGLNDVSSRSHGVLSVIVSNGCAKGKLNLIDLAGNEDNRRTCNVGVRLQESAKINQSLFALSNVIYALNNNESRVPYRESKLTRILQDSLGGTSRALMVACLNPGSYPEAVHTVSLAARSRHIGNYMLPKEETPKVKVDMEAKLRAWLESKGKTKGIQRLNGPRSPFPGNTPLSPSRSTSKKLDGSKSLSAVFKSNGRGLYKGSAPRKLFDSAASVPASANMRDAVVECSESHVIGRELDMNEPKADYDVDRTIADEMSIPINKSIADEIGIQLNQTQGEYHTPPNLDNKSDAALHLDKQPKTNNSSDFEHAEYSKVVPNLHKENVSFIDQSCEEKHLHTLVAKVGAPSIHVRTPDFQRSLKKVLSPVNTDSTQTNYLSQEEKLFIVKMENKTPTKPSACTHENGEIESMGTPLDKFHALGSTMKNSLAKEFLAFLNVANKEELLALKGIGQKRADYIFELRGITPQPFESLADLEKIGLSLKQAHDLFQRAARGIFL